MSYINNAHIQLLSAIKNKDKIMYLAYKYKNDR
jgi:hypothetical protein